MTDVLIATCLMAAGLGARHALDPDHITIIDGCARRNASDRPLIAYLSGVLFSAGHSAIVVLGALVAASIGKDLSLPSWLEASGWLVAVSVLLVLGALNLHAAFSAPSGGPVELVGWKARLVGRGGDHPLAICSIGMLLAFSFDTLAQASLLGIAGANLPVAGGVFLLADSFAIGMIGAGGAAGIGIALLARSAARYAEISSRIMAAAIGALNLGIGAIAISTAISTGVEHWFETQAMIVTLSVLTAAMVAYIFAILAARTKAPPAPGR